nr:hypothetical protein [Streptomyces spiralis]
MKSTSPDQPLYPTYSALLGSENSVPSMRQASAWLPGSDQYVVSGALPAGVNHWSRPMPFPLVSEAV